jgi:hypothetical protein
MTTEDELAALTAAFLAAVTFAPGERPHYDAIRGLFIDQGVLIRNIGTLDITTVDEFIAPRQALVDSGALTEFEELELAHITEVFGNVAHREVLAHERVLEHDRRVRTAWLAERARRP